MMSFVAPTSAELAQKISDGVTRNYQSQLSTFEAEINKAKTQVSNYQSHIGALCDQRDEVSSELQGFRDDLDAVASKRASYSGRLAAARRQAEDARDRVSSARLAKQQAEYEFHQAENRLHSLQKPVDDGRFKLEMQRWESRIDDIDRQIQDATRKLKDAQQYSEDLDRQIRDYDGNDYFERQRLADAHRQSVEDEYRHQQRIDSLEDSKLQFPKPIDDGRFDRETAQYNADKDQYERARKQAKSLLSDAESALQSAESDFRLANSDVDELLAEPAQLDAEESRLPDLIDGKEDELSEVNDDIASAQQKLSAWKQTLQQSTAKKARVESTRDSEARAKAQAFQRSNHGQVVSSWHRITENYSKNRRIWEDCVSNVAQAEDKKWANLALPEYVKAHNDLKAQKTTNESFRARAHGDVESQQRQIADVVAAHLAGDRRNRWALYSPDTGRHTVLNQEQSQAEIQKYIAGFGSNPAWGNVQLVSVRTKPLTTFWILLAITVLSVFTRLLIGDVFGLTTMAVWICGLAAFGNLVYRGITKSQGTNVEWVDEQKDWSVIAGNLYRAISSANQFDQRAAQITAKSRQIIESNKQAVARKRAQITVADVEPHVHRAVPQFCVFPRRDSDAIASYCSQVVKDFVAQGNSNAQLNLQASKYPLSPKVKYSGNDHYVQAAISQYDSRKIR
ncbi:hypothetical protein [Corynebacterium sp. LK33]|uniref:hypothetical protein n=1 Tax=Corynebacterium sp. LK33 TaxID=2044574 RepID=UPI001651E48E|nr:hypothetical protein [Corynebacterium sp. LK33]MBC6822082.1 hypothetical protein [Corynebacterium sp. LK33]